MDWNKVEYVRDAQAARKQPAKLLILSNFFGKVFGVNLEDLLPGIEAKIGSRILGVRGSVDVLFGDVALEIKLDLDREMDDARRELIKYLQALYEKEPGRRHIGIVTDAVKFVAFAPVMTGQRVSSLEEVGSVDLAAVSPQDGILWLDAFLFSKRGVKPTAEDLRWRFGPGSPTYALAVRDLGLGWAKVQSDEGSTLKLSLWSSLMEIVYGSSPREQAFIDHTYLVTLVKLIAYLKLSRTLAPNADDISDALTGRYFRNLGIVNFIEEDFFAWTSDQKIVENSLELALGLARQLLRYEIKALDEDVFKEIYQQIVKKSERHRVGEYYTPEWAAELALNKALETWKARLGQGVPRILDPACGSGTFLTNAVRLLRNDLVTKPEGSLTPLDVILENVMGADINPLAGVIAKANYILALGELVTAERRKISIPVFVCDTMKLPEVVRTLAGHTDVYDVNVDDTHLQIPVRIASDRALCSLVIDVVTQTLTSYKARSDRTLARSNFLAGARSYANKDELQALLVTLDTLMNLIDHGHDTIWPFMLNNVYAPIALRDFQFHIIIGNPPWIVMRTIENPDYQKFLRDSVETYGLLDKKRMELYTQLEMATLFFVRSSDLYLRKDGVIGFLMPISVLSAAAQHIAFQRFEKPVMKLQRILNMEKVTPVFSLPFCILIADLSDRTSYPVPVTLYSGRIDRFRRNERLGVVSDALTVSEGKWSIPELPEGVSFYYPRVTAGASLYPRNFCFIEFEVSPLGFDKDKPPVRTSEEAIRVGKAAWEGIRLRGNIESQFIFATLLGKDLIRFGIVEFRPVFLPAEPQAKGFRLMDVEELERKHAPEAAKWLKEAQTIWEQKRTEKSEENFPRILDRFDQYGLLSGQNPHMRYVLLYNSRGADAMPVVIDRRNVPLFSSGIAPMAFMADVTTHLYETDLEDEAHYLCAILSSGVANKAVKRFQPRGLYGPRDIGRREFRLPIPKFDQSITEHIKLSTLSRQCHAKIRSLTFENKGFRHRRGVTKKALSREMSEIDSIVTHLLGL